MPPGDKKPPPTLHFLTALFPKHGIWGKTEPVIPTTEMRPSHHPVQMFLAMMKPLGVVLRPTFTVVRSLFWSILGSDLVILWVTLKSSPSRCHIVSPHAHQSSHAITSTPPPPDLSKTASLRPLYQQLWREHFLTHTDGVRMQKTDCSENLQRSTRFGGHTRTKVYDFLSALKLLMWAHTTKRQV